MRTKKYIPSRGIFARLFARRGSFCGEVVEGSFSAKWHGISDREKSNILKKIKQLERLHDIDRVFVCISNSACENVSKEAVDVFSSLGLNHCKNNAGFLLFIDVSGTFALVMGKSLYKKLSSFVVGMVTEIKNFFDDDFFGAGMEFLFAYIGQLLISI